MGRLKRIEKAEQDLRILEKEFEIKPRRALQAAAAGRWGVFGAYAATMWATVGRVADS